MFDEAAEQISRNKMVIIKYINMISPFICYALLVSFEELFIEV